MNSNSVQYIPDEAYLFFPTDVEIKTAQGVRRIFNNLPFDDKEKEKIAAFKAYCAKNKHNLTELWIDPMILRFLQANGFKFDKTWSSTLVYNEFRKTKLPIKMNPKIEAFFNAGILYIHGRDNRYRPIVVFNIYKIDIKKLDVDTMIDSLTFILEFMMDELFLPGQVENWIFIMDLNHMGLGSLSLGPLKKLMSYLQTTYRGYLYAMYIINTPGSIFLPWRMVKGFLDEATIKKINFFDKGIPEPLFTHANKEQVEKKFGGFAKDLTTFWPPVFPSSNYLLSTDNPAKVLIPKESYNAKYKRGELKNYKVNAKFINPIEEAAAKPLSPDVINLDISSTKTTQPKNSNLKDVPNKNVGLEETDFILVLMDENPKTKRIPIINKYNGHYSYFHPKVDYNNLSKLDFNSKIQPGSFSKETTIKTTSSPQVQIKDNGPSLNDNQKSEMKRNKVGQAAEVSIKRSKIVQAL